MKEYIKKWFFLETLYYKDDFQEINNLNYVHPNDWDFVKNNFTNTFYECIDIDNEYLIIKNKKYKLRIKPNVIKGYLLSPKFKWGERVIISNKNKEAVIDDFIWHQKDKTFYYYLLIDGKKKSKRFSEDELLFR